MASSNPPVLLDFWVSPYGQRVRIAMIEKGIVYGYREEAGLLDNKSELLLKSNPVFKQIPVLIHDGKPVCDSLVILEYVDEIWPNKMKLAPAIRSASEGSGALLG